jgi:hypothetical protein
MSVWILLPFEISLFILMLHILIGNISIYLRYFLIIEYKYLPIWSKISSYMRCSWWFHNPYGFRSNISLNLRPRYRASVVYSDPSSFIIGNAVARVSLHLHSIHWFVRGHRVIFESLIVWCGICLSIYDIVKYDK